MYRNGFPLGKSKWHCLNPFLFKSKWFQTHVYSTWRDKKRRVCWSVAGLVFSAPDCVLCPPPIQLPGENTAAALELFRTSQGWTEGVSPVSGRSLGAVSGCFWPESSEPFNHGCCMYKSPVGLNPCLAWLVAGGQPFHERYSCFQKCALAQDSSDIF